MKYKEAMRMSQREFKSALDNMTAAESWASLGEFLGSLRPKHYVAMIFVTVVFLTALLFTYLAVVKAAPKLCPDTAVPIPNCEK